MDIESQLTTSGTTKILVCNVWYTVEDGRGVGQEPIIHLRGRDKNGEDDYSKILGFRPFFFISEEEFVQRRDDLELEFDRDTSSLLDYDLGHKGIDKETNEIIPLVKLIIETPYDVRGLADEFKKTWEADVQYPKQFIREKGISDTVRVPTSDEFHHSKISVPDESLSQQPRIVTTDIEIGASGVFPDIEFPDIEITCLAAHDSYRDDYWAGILTHDDWPSDARERVEACYDDREIEPSINIFDSEKAMLAEYISVVNDWNPNILTGWNSNGFDYPYLINRAYRLNCYSIQKWSETGQVSEIEDDGWGANANHAIKGLMCWDMMDAYEEAQFHSLKSKSLGHVAEEELGFGKDDIEDYRQDWIDRPAEYLRYNIRDVEATVGIAREADVVKRWGDLQQLTGTPYADANHNKNVIDSKFLQKSLEYEN